MLIAMVMMWKNLIPILGGQFYFSVIITQNTLIKLVKLTLSDLP